MRTFFDPFRFATLLLSTALVATGAPASEVESGETDVVARSAVTTAVVDREPTNRVDALGTDHDQVFYFTEIRDQTGRTLTHRWTFQDQVVAEVPFAIGGPRWRVHSSKKLLPDWTGPWTVSVVDETGAILKQDHFTYGESSPPPAPDTAAAKPPDTLAPPAAPAAPTESPSAPPTP